MKMFKKITSMALAVVMMFSCITVISSNVVKAAVNTEEWQNTAIISPTQGKLIGAGYIDVKWNNRE